MENKEIRFIDSKYNELFRIPDNSKINVKYADGHIEERTCKYIDDYHMEINGNCFHICQWAGIMEKNGNTYYPAEETTHNIEKTENEQLVEKYADGAKRDKFFKNPNGFTEVYYNPDSTAGGQLVYNEISHEVIKDAAAHSRNAREFFEYIDSYGTVSLIDIDTPEFKPNFKSFIQRKADFENCTPKTMNGLKKDAGIEIPKPHKSKNFER